VRLQIAPEIEARVRQEAAARGVSVDRVLNEALKLYQDRHELPVVRRVPDFQDSTREMAWAANPDLQYVNEWVALEGDQVIAHGADAKVVYEFARAKGISAPFMFFVEERESIPFVGGWK
jgi:hypothetical protein